MILRLWLFVLVGVAAVGCQTTQHIHLNLDLPDGYKLLQAAKPSFTVYTDKGETVQTFALDAPQQTFTVLNKGRYLRAVAKVYYCPIEAEGLCVIHEATFDIQGAKRQNYLFYTLPGDS